MNTSSLILGSAVLTFSLLASACGGDDSTDGTGGASNGGDPSTGGSASGGEATSGGSTSGGNSSGGGTASGGGSGELTCAPQGGVKPLAADCGGLDSSFELRVPLAAGDPVAVYINMPTGGTAEISLENEECSESPTSIYSGSVELGKNCFPLTSPGDFTRLRINTDASSGSAQFQLCPHGACVNQ